MHTGVVAVLCAMHELMSLNSMCAVLCRVEFQASLADGLWVGICTCAASYKLPSTAWAGLGSVIWRSRCSLGQFWPLGSVRGR